ncbi:MAG: DUF2007 domain-containing protein [Thermoanaerobaculia bacterium]
MDKLVKIFTTDYFEAQIIKGKLEAEGIPVLLTYDSAAVVYGLTADGLGKVEIKVPEEYVEEAKKLIEESEKLEEGENTDE